MKLQRNNKYAKRLTAGLASAILSASILVGCTSANISTPVPTPTEIVQIDETPLIKDVNYYLNYYKISDEEAEKKLEDYDIKYSNAKWCIAELATIVVKDINNDYKVLLCIERVNEDNETIGLYDLFTEEHLFDKLVEVNLPYDNDLKYSNPNIEDITNKSSYFDDKEIVEYGPVFYSSIFIKAHIDYFREKDGIDYISPELEPFYCLYPKGEFYLIKTFYTTKEITKCYVKTVPEECRVTSKELGVESTYNENRKYADCWKISEEEKQKRIEELVLYNPTKKICMAELKTLVVKDSENNYKIIETMIFDNENVSEFYNAISGEYLFSIPQISELKFDHDSEKYYINFNELIDEIPYFEDKTIEYLGSGFETNYFTDKHLKEFGERDGIHYEGFDRSYYNYLFLDGADNFSLYYTVKEIADYYTTVLPIELQVTPKELQIGMNNNNKVLVK